MSLSNFARRINILGRYNTSIRFQKTPPMTHPTFTRASKDLVDQKKRVLALYRECIRNAEHICEIYGMNYPPSVIKKTMRSLFEENRYMTGSQLDTMLTKGQMELREALMVWKQPTHIERMINRYLMTAKEANKLPEGFLQKFIKGTK